MGKLDSPRAGIARSICWATLGVTSSNRPPKTRVGTRIRWSSAVRSMSRIDPVIVNSFGPFISEYTWPAGGHLQAVLKLGGPGLKSAQELPVKLVDSAKVLRAPESFRWPRAASSPPGPRRGGSAFRRAISRAAKRTSANPPTVMRERRFARPFDRIGECRVILRSSSRSRGSAPVRAPCANPPPPTRCARGVNKEWSSAPPTFHIPEGRIGPPDIRRRRGRRRGASNRARLPRTAVKSQQGRIGPASERPVEQLVASDPNESFV